MKPPYYHAIVSALQLQDRYGLKPEAGNQEAESIRRTAIDNNLHRDHNLGLWADFILQHPSDKAAKYMRQYVLS